MAGYVPIMLDCENRSCIIIGGGEVAERKTLGLLAASASVRIISPRLTPVLKDLYLGGRIEWLNREYVPGDLEGGFLVHAATNEDEVNLQIGREAMALGILVNVANDPVNGTFINPSVLRRGRLTVAVSTSGAGPLAAASICDKLEEEFGEEYAEYMEFLYMMRKSVREQVTDSGMRKKLLKKIHDIDILEQIRLGGYVPWDAERIRQWIVNNQEE